MAEYITSQELGDEPAKLGGEVGTLDIYDGLPTPFSDDVVELTPRHQYQIEQYAIHAAAAFGPKFSYPEPTYAQTAFDIPALVTRVDCTIVNGNIVAYEMEDSPSGQGITDTIHRMIGGAGIKDILRTHYEQSVGTLPHVVISHARSHGTDDALIVGENNYTYDVDGHAPLPTHTPVIVKAIPGEPTSAAKYLPLQPYALAPLVSEGDKTYLERLGHVIPVEHESQLLHTNRELASQALKAIVGSMGQGVSLYLTPQDRKSYGKSGSVTAARLKNDLYRFSETRGGALTQPFAPPLQLHNLEERRNAILRVFTLLRGVNGELAAKAIGGCYVARPEVLINGASNAIAGAIVTRENIYAELS